MAPFEPDARQRVVLEHSAGPMLVTGGFGTGKTAVLRERFARLIEGGSDPERVALVVGSRRARDEARAYLLERLGIALPALTVVTIHGLAFHVVGQRYGALGYAAPPKVLSASEQFARVRELLAGEDPSAWPAYGALLPLEGFADQVRQLLIRAQEALVTPEDIERRAASSGLGGWGELAAFLRHYLSVLDAAGEVDFAGLVEQAAVAAGSGESPFDHVMVDDHQDATAGAERLLAELRAQSLAVAGNLGAHVFSFQGTTDEPLRRFAERNLGVTHVELETRHRPAPVLAEAWHAEHVSEQHAAVARELRRIHVEEGVRWGKLAVVSRRHGPHSAGLLRALDDAHVPRVTSESGPPASLPATRPYVLGLRWLAATEDERDELIEPLLTSELGRLSPATSKTLLRLVRAHGHRPAEALARHQLLDGGADGLGELHATLERASTARGSVLDAFRILWQELPCSAELAERATTDHHARVDLDAVVQLSEALTERSDTSVEAWVSELGSAEGGPELAAGGREEIDAVGVLTAHAAAGRGFDTVFVLDVLEGDFPSLRRPEPMFDLATLDGTPTRAEVNRARLADERRLFTMVLARAARRVVLVATDPHGRDGVSLTSRFVEELGVEWTPAPGRDLREPVSVREASASWRSTLADSQAAAVERLACLQGLLSLGTDPRRWWFQLDWTELGPREREKLNLSYSRLSTLENCDLQFVLSSELGLDPGGGFQAWVGKLVHSIIEDCENGKVERTPEAFRRALDERWERGRFTSHAISEAELANAKDVIVPNWFERYADPPATATEQGFSFPFDGATIRGKIDRIGPGPDGSTRITDYKSGRSDSAPKPSESLQLGIYYLAVSECEELEEHRPVAAVELAYLGGKKGKPALDVKEWPVSAENEEDYKARMRERISGLIGHIRDLDRDGSYYANTKAGCFFCGFRTMCTRYPQGAPVFPVTRPASGGTSG